MTSAGSWSGWRVRVQRVFAQLAAAILNRAELASAELDLLLRDQLRALLLEMTALALGFLAIAVALVASVLALPTEWRALALASAAVLLCVSAAVCLRMAHLRRSRPPLKAFLEELRSDVNALRPDEPKPLHGAEPDETDQSRSRSGRASAP